MLVRIPTLLVLAGLLAACGTPTPSAPPSPALSPTFPPPVAVARSLAPDEAPLRFENRTAETLLLFDPAAPDAPPFEMTPCGGSATIAAPMPGVGASWTVVLAVRSDGPVPYKTVWMTDADGPLAMASRVVISADGIDIDPDASEPAPSCAPLPKVAAGG